MGAQERCGLALLRAQIARDSATTSRDSSKTSLAMTGLPATHH
jgi:hypothetical protein